MCILQVITYSKPVNDFQCWENKGLHPYAFNINVINFHQIYLVLYFINLFKKIEACLEKDYTQLREISPCPSIKQDYLFINLISLKKLHRKIYKTLILPLNYKCNKKIKK